jgi:hypothetical protein
MLRFRARVGDLGIDILGTLDVNLINNTFINNDYSVSSDQAVSVGRLKFGVVYVYQQDA